MKHKILTYLETDRGFSTGKQLYANAPGKSLSFINTLNRMNDTPANCEKLHYELAKVAGITERHLGIIMRNPVKEAEKEKGIKITNASEGESFALSALYSFENTEVEQLIEILKQNDIKNCIVHPEFEKGLPGMAARKKFIKDHNLNVKGKTKKALDDSIEDWYKSEIILIVKNTIKSRNTIQFINSDEKDKQSVKLHDQFPFLSEDDCPDVYKILVADMVTAYRKYKAAHPRLFDELTAEERLEAAKAIVTPYKENKLIWDELEHYQANRKPLGKHPLLIAAQRTADIVAMKTPELVKLQANLVNNINRNKKKLETLEGAKATEKVALITEQETELHIVDTELKQR